ncbi:hypothetical protein FQN60_015500, partial [Etheostoma spectabile]
MSPTTSKSPMTTEDKRSSEETKNPTFENNDDGPARARLDGRTGAVMLMSERRRYERQTAGLAASGCNDTLISGKNMSALLAKQSSKC